MAGTKTSSSDSGQQARARRIAVVDDDVEVRDYLSDGLTAAGYEVRVASNGLRLVSVLEVDPPDLILLDVVMKWVNGFDLCRALKRNPEFCTIPVVFVSARTAPRDVEHGLACGAVDYIPKPIDVDTLLQRISALLP